MTLKQGSNWNSLNLQTTHNQNVAVKDGSVDINAFQHYNFLDNWNSKNDNALVAVADTYIAPIRLYSGNRKR